MRIRRDGLSQRNLASAATLDMNADAREPVPEAADNCRRGSAGGATWPCAMYKARRVRRSASSAHAPPTRSAATTAPRARRRATAGRPMARRGTQTSRGGACGSRVRAARRGAARGAARRAEWARGARRRLSRSERVRAALAMQSEQGRQKKEQRLPDADGRRSDARNTAERARRVITIAQMRKRAAAIFFFFFFRDGQKSLRARALQSALRRSSSLPSLPI